MKKALITGITGQDGSYLAELLISKGYEVHGVLRQSSSSNTARIDHLLRGMHVDDVRLLLHNGNLTNGASLRRIIDEVQPDEVYNLGAQSRVAVSFERAEYTANVDALGTLRLLEAIRASGLTAASRFYQASTSELYGRVTESPQHENTPFRPRSPYAVAKLHAYWSTINYREGWGLHATNGILFNHESPRRGEMFVTRKITKAVARIATGGEQPLYLGNLDAQRDWGHARDYVEGMWRMVQQPDGDDYVLATGETHSVREFVEAAFSVAGIEITWKGEGIGEMGRDANGRTLVKVNPCLFRPAEVDLTTGDASKAKAVLGWIPQTSFRQIITEMVQADLAALAVVHQSGRRTSLAEAPIVPAGQS